MYFQHLSDLGWNNYFQSQLTFEQLDTQLPFRVISQHRSQVECIGLDKNGQPIDVALGSHFWRNADTYGRPTVGDWLMLDEQLQPQQLLERKSLLKRKSAGQTSTLQLIAANIDTLFIVSSCNEDFSLNRLERYLSIANESAIHCVAVITKADLCSDTSVFVQAIANAHPSLAIETLNATHTDELDSLKQWIGVGQTTALLGSSGVGKSTIINGLTAAGVQKTGAIRESDSKGRHTTTGRSLHRLSGGGLLIDTPGMRELQMVDSEHGIKTTFQEIEILAENCRFKNCSHTTEPGCAVLQAIESDELESRLLDNYHKLLSEQARNNESVAERRSNDRTLGRFYKNAQKTSKKFKSRD